MKFHRALLLLAALLSGCEDPAAPAACDAEFACEVEGLDIALLGVIPRWTAAQSYEDEVGAHVVEPGDTLAVDVLLVNRGTVAGTDSILVYGFFRDFQYFVSSGGLVRPLGVGERAFVELRFVVPPGPRWVIGSGAQLLAPGTFAIDGDFEEEDVDPSNHVGPPVAYHPRVPILDVAPLDLGDTMRTRVAYETTVEVANRSPFADFTGGLELVFCNTHPGHDYCESGALAAHSPLVVGPVAAGQTVAIEHVIEFTRTSVWYFDTPSAAFVNPCLQADAPRLCLHRADSEDDYAVVIPSLAQECVTEPLSPPDTLRATESLCLVTHGADQGTAHTIGVFGGLAGDCYRITRLGDEWSASVLDTDLALVPSSGEPGMHCLPHDGTYYLKAYSVATSDPSGGVVAIEPEDS